MVDRVFLGLIVLGVVGLQVAGTDAPFTIELRVPVRDVVVFEPLDATAVIRNRSPETQRIDIYRFGRFESRVPGGEWKRCFDGTIACPMRPTERDFGPGATVDLGTDLAFECGGYDSPGAREYRYAYDTISSKPVSIVYREAVGVDREALDSVSTWQFTWQEAVRLFPTSIYAGHDLYQTRRLDAEHILGDRTAGDHALVGSLSRERLRRRMEDCEKAEQRIKRLRQFLDARPGFQHARALRLDLAAHFAQADLFAEAAEVCAALMREDSNGPEGMKAAVLLASMDRVGFYKAK